MNDRLGARAPGRCATPRHLIQVSQDTASRSQEREDIRGARRMPWHMEPTKDAASCDNPRLGAHTLRPAGLRMGEPARSSPCIPLPNSYGGGGQPGELKHLSTRRRGNQLRDPPSSGERKGAEAKPASAYGRQPSRRRGCRASIPTSGGVGVHSRRGAERHGKAGRSGLEPRTRTQTGRRDAVPE